MPLFWLCLSCCQVLVLQCFCPLHELLCLQLLVLSSSICNISVQQFLVFLGVYSEEFVGWYYQYVLYLYIFLISAESLLTSVIYITELDTFNSI